MPYHVDSEHPDCAGHAVVKDDSGEVMGCHKTMDAAHKQMAAMYANEGGGGRAQMSAMSINDLPDSDFAYIEPGGSKDESGKTVPRSKRHFPIHDAAHVRNALARAPQSPFGAKAMQKIHAAARKFGIEVSEEKSQPPTDNLVRSRAGDDAIQLDGEGRILHGRFAVFNQWANITSSYEGDFRERILPGAFTRSLEEHRDRIKVLYDHGKDPQLGNKPLGKIVELREDDEGVYYEVELIDTSYNNEFMIPALRAGLLGASFRFSIPADGDTWNRGRTERTISEADVYEFGPVTWPAYVGATAGIRSGTDDFIDSLIHDPRFMARFIDRSGSRAAAKFLEGLPPTAQTRDTVQPPPAPDTTQSDDSDHVETPSVPSFAERQQRARQIRLAQMRRA